MEIAQSIYDALGKSKGDANAPAAIPVPSQVPGAATAATTGTGTGTGIIPLEGSTPPAAAAPDPAAIAAAATATPAPAAVPPVPGAPTPAPAAFDPNAWLAEQSGGKVKTWAEVELAMSKPAERIEVPVQPIFANEMSKSLYEAIVAGEDEKVLPILQAKVFAKNVATLSPEEVVKTKIKLEFPSFDSSDVEAEFQTRYQPNANELDAVVFEREKKKAGDRLKKDAAEAVTYFSGAVQTLELPKVAQPAATPQAQPLSADAQLAVALGENYAVDKVSNVPFEFAVPDTSIVIKGQTALPTKAVEELRAKIENHPDAFLAGFIAKRWGTANGTLDPLAVARDIFALDNPQVISNSVAEQSYNLAVIEGLKRNKNYNQGAATPPSGGFQDDGEATNGFNRLFRIPGEKPAPAAAPN